MYRKHYLGNIAVRSTKVTSRNPKVYERPFFWKKLHTMKGAQSAKRKIKLK